MSVLAQQRASLGMCAPTASLVGLGFSEGSLKKPHDRALPRSPLWRAPRDPRPGQVSSGAASCLEAPVQSPAPCPSCDGSGQLPLRRATWGGEARAGPRCPQRLLAWLSTGPSLTGLGCA